VQGITVADAMNGIEQCSLLKIDCEGAEYDFFPVVPPEVWGRVDRLAMEWHSYSENRDERVAQGSGLVDRLIAAGFHIVSFTEAVGFRGGMIFARR
jgi:hypothetical protein